MGRNVTSRLGKNQLVHQMYELYDLSRNKELVVFTKPLKGGKEKIVVVRWPTGFGTLPDAGGWNDQSYITTRLFSAAMRGEEQGASRLMSKN